MFFLFFMWKIQWKYFLQPNKAEESILCCTSILVESIFNRIFLFHMKFSQKISFFPYETWWVSTSLGIFHIKSVFMKGFVLFHMDLSMSLVLFSWEFGVYYKTITLFLFFIKNIFLRRNVNTHAGEGMSLFLCVGKQQ